MSLNCTNINLKKGSTGNTVKELQQILKDKKYYTGKIDGDFGTITETSVKKFQKDNKLLQDGIVGSVTCKKLQTTTTSTTTKSTAKNGVYTSSPHWTGKGCNKLGQCTAYYCGVHSIRQCNAKQDIDAYTEATLAGYAGTTRNGTGHGGIETAIATVARKEGIKISVTWKNFSDLGSNRTERWKKLGELISTQNTGVIIHNLYRNQYGHYEVLKDINMNKSTCTVLNSLGSKCTSTAYCGYLETRSFSTMESYMKGISQKSICIMKFGG